MDSNNSKTRLFNSGGIVKLAYFQKKWSIPLSSSGTCFEILEKFACRHYFGLEVYYVRRFGVDEIIFTIEKNQA